MQTRAAESERSEGGAGARVALTIAGSDPSGGAGLQADLKTFHRHGVYGASAVTLLTVQNTRGVERVEMMDPGLVVAQIEAVVSDLPPAAAKTGALGSAGVIRAVAERARGFAFPLVVDPVMISKHGHALLDEEGVAALREALLPRAFVATPNRHEAGRLAGFEIVDADGAERAAAAIRGMGAEHVVVKGVPNERGRAVDLVLSGGRVELLDGPRHETARLHGSGCVFAAALTARLALGCGLGEAVRLAKAFTAEAIRTAPALGGGVGPLNMLAGLGGGAVGGG